MLTGEAAPDEKIDRIGGELFDLFVRAKAEGVPPPLLADRIAEERLRASAGSGPYFPGGGR